MTTDKGAAERAMADLSIAIYDIQAISPSNRDAAKCLREAEIAIESAAKHITALAAERDAMRNKYHAVYRDYRSVLKAVMPMRDALTDIKDDIEDEGDRVYFGSTNDADSFREIAERLDAIAWDEIIDPAHKQAFDLFAELDKTRAERNALKDLLADCYRHMHDAYNEEQPSRYQPPEPADKWSYEAVPLFVAIQRATGKNHGELIEPAKKAEG